MYKRSRIGNKGGGGSGVAVSFVWLFFPCSYPSRIILSGGRFYLQEREGMGLVDGFSAGRVVGGQLLCYTVFVSACLSFTGTYTTLHCLLVAFVTVAAALSWLRNIKRQVMFGGRGGVIYGFPYGSYVGSYGLGSEALGNEVLC